MQSRWICAALSAVLLAGPAACGARSEDQPSRQVASDARELFDTLATMELSATPEQITRLGLRPGLLGPQEEAVLGDRSQAGYERLRLRRIEALRLLESMPLAPEGSALHRHQEAVLRTYDNMVRVAEFGHGRAYLGDAYPYVIDHRSGGWIDLPRMLVSSQPVGSRLEANDYVSRLVALSHSVDDERLRLLADAAAGVAPPDFILDRMLAVADAKLAVPVEDDVLLVTLDNRLPGVTNMNEDARGALLATAKDVLNREVRPAYMRLREAIVHVQGQASAVPGVWALKDGDAYYDAVLALHIRPGVSAESLHREGRATVASLETQLDTHLIEAGLIDGTIGARLAAYAALPEQAWESPDALLDAIDALIARNVRGMAGWIARAPETTVVAAAIPAMPGRGGAEAFYVAPAPNGTRPGTFFISAENTVDWPRYSLPALTLHETVPGHHTEASFAMELAGLPLIRQLSWHTGYVEGWATYAETLALESGLYADDPGATIGILQSQLFSAARMVADTGLHRMRWTREEAVEYLVETTGMGRARMEDEVDRMVVWPGQASAYVAGARQIGALRERAEAVIGPEIDLAAFHFNLLSGGPRPLAQAEADMERWYEARMAAQN